jgi:hypothetical protein
MPAWGLVPDSPWIYAAQKLARKGSVSYRPSGPRKTGLSTSFRYSSSRVIIYKSALNFETHDSAGMVGKYLNKIGQRIVRGARRQVGVRTGNLRRSIELQHIVFREGAAIKVGSRLNYAYMHHEGTKPHVITPNPPNTVLVFGKGTRVIHARAVNHPGAKPNRYLSDQLRIHIRG